MKVKFNYKETVWFEKPIEVEIDMDDLIFEYGEAINEQELEQAIRDFIYSNYSTQELKDLNTMYLGDGDTTIDILEIKEL